MLKRKMRDQITELTYRVKDLEERLCPAQQHDWKQVDYTFDKDGDTLYTYQCVRCGKKCRTWKIL